MDRSACARALGTAEKPDIVKRLHMRCISVTLTLTLAAAYQIEATSMSVCSNSAISSTTGTLAGTLMSYYDSANVGLLPGALLLVGSRRNVGNHT
jgi:hypothetical protein